MEYDLTELLKDGRCAQLAPLIEDEPKLDFSRVAEDVRIHIMCSKDKFESGIALKIKELLLQKFTDSMRVPSQSNG